VLPKDIIDAMTRVDGDVEAAADLLQVHPAKLITAINNDLKLKVRYSNRVKGFDSEMLSEVPPDLPGAPAASEVQLQNVDIVLNGLKAAGIKQETLNKMSVMSNFEGNAGVFLAQSLSLMHQMVVYNAATLMEQAEHIKSKYLDSESTPAKERIIWQRLYNQVTDAIGKNHDRVLHGSVALAKLAPGKNASTKKAKPGFVPLTTDGKD